MLKGSEIKEKSIIIINGEAFFIAFKSKVVQTQKTILIGLTIKEIIAKRLWPIIDTSYDVLNNYVIDESGVSCDNGLKECRIISGVEKMKLQTTLLNNQLSEVAACID